MRLPHLTMSLLLLSWLGTASLVVADPLPVPPPDVPATAQPSPSPSAQPDTETSPTYYKTFLDGSRPLGFAPDQHLFDQVRDNIHLEAYESPSDTQIYKTAEGEARALVTQAGQKPDALDRIQPNGHMAQEIVGAYSRTIDKNLIWYALIRGELRSLDDPYSVLMIPDDYRHMMDSMEERSFGGIGVYIELDKNNDNKLTVTEPIDGTPAAKAGLEAGDVIADIDGKSTDGMAIDTAAAMLRGEIGSKVRLGIDRKGNNAPLDVDVTRDSIHPVTVTSRMLEKHIGYVRLRLFGEHTGTELAEALDDLRTQGMKALVLDLRNNGGGYIRTAVDVCSNFVPAGDLIVSVEHRTGTPEELRAHPTPLSAHPLPMVLLVNGYSASASEITAGCLKDLGVATLVGVKTFGKGSVQNVEKLPQGAALKLTIAHFFSPKHNPIHHVGVLPDVEVPMEPKLVGHDGDAQLTKAVDVLASRLNAMR
ncbi:MAG TPA: S41 family peptidase [Candidatus Xenobia bacterium]|jgi:carboxyl-terminal processing protease